MRIIIIIITVILALIMTVIIQCLKTVTLEEVVAGCI